MFPFQFLTAIKVDSIKNLEAHLNTRSKASMGSGSASFNNMKNAIIAFLVPLPSILFYLSFLKHYDSATGTGADPSLWSSLWTWCYHHPLLLANVVFFFNVNVLFWVIGLIQSSHWVKFFPFSSSFSSLTFCFKVDNFCCC